LTQKVLTSHGQNSNQIRGKPTSEGKHHGQARTKSGRGTGDQQKNKPTGTLVLRTLSRGRKSGRTPEELRKKKGTGRKGRGENTKITSTTLSGFKKKEAGARGEGEQGGK